MQYAKLISETAIDRNAPRSATIGGRLIVGRLPAAALAAIGYYPLDETAPAPVPQDGCHMEPRYAYDDAEAPSRIVRTWVAVADPPPPPRTFRKSWLAQWMRANGKWDAFKALLASPGAEELAFLWETSTEFDEDHPQWEATIAEAKDALHLTDEDADAMLAFGAAGG